jgi:tRNA(fMet)-specific endonuclease VapC
MAYLLDTNAWVAHLRQKHPRVTQEIIRVGPADIRLCTVVLAELIYGAYRSGPSHEAAAGEWGRVRHHLAAQGTPIGPNDLLIAAIALAHGLTLVTHNTAEFGRVPGLAIEDWQAP